MQFSFRNFFQKSLIQPQFLNMIVNNYLIVYLLLMFVYYVDVH